MGASVRSLPSSSAFSSRLFSWSPSSFSQMRRARPLPSVSQTRLAAPSSRTSKLRRRDVAFGRVGEARAFERAQRGRLLCEGTEDVEGVHDLPQDVDSLPHA